jgi:tyrosyl-tRNA synthetase
MDGVPTVEFLKATIESGIDIVSLLAETNIFPSKGEARKMVQGGGVSINKVKVEGIELNTKEITLLNGRYLLVQKGKKNYYLIKTI